MASTKAAARRLGMDFLDSDGVRLALGSIPKRCLITGRATVNQVAAWGPSQAQPVPLKMCDTNAVITMVARL